MAENIKDLHTDREAVLYMIKDDKQGLELLFRKYYTPLCQYATKLVKDRETAEDLVQEVFYKLWKNRFNLKEDVLMKPYLYRATKNTFLNHIKASDRVDLRDDIAAFDTPENMEESGDGIDYSELEEKVEEAVCSLPDKCQEVFRLSRYREMSYKEIANELNISVKTVENHMGKALKIMREHLKRYLG